MNCLIKKTIKQIVCLALPILLVLASSPAISAEKEVNGQNIANTIAKFTAKAIYNLDADQLLAILESYLSEHKNIKGLIVTETLENDRLLSYFLDEAGNAVFNAEIPESIKQLDRFVATSSVDSEDIGQIELFYPVSPVVTLTPEEKEWLIANPEITVGTYDWEPFIGANNQGEATGIVGDYLKLLSDRTGLNFKNVGGFFSEIYDMFKANEIDLIPAAYFNEERTKIGLFSEPYLKVLEYLYVLEDNQNINGFEDLNNKRLAVTDNYGALPGIRELFPDIEIVIT